MHRHPVGRSATIRELNERNRAFWEEQASLFYRRLADPVIVESINDELEHYSAWSVPVPYQKSLEKW